MKKLLLASTILGLTAGMSSAEVTLSGDARMGLLDDFGTGGAVFTSRARVKFTMSGESDTGFSFGADFRADNAVDAASGKAGSVFIAMNGFKLSMGDVDGAAQAAVGQADGVGLTGLSDLNEIAFLGTGGASGSFLDAGFFATQPTTPAINGDPSMLLEYSNGAVSVYASATQLNYTFAEPCCTWTKADSYALGAAYTAGGYKLSLGYEKWDGERATAVTTASVDNVVVGADATFGGVTVKARYSKGGSEFAGFAFQDHTQWALSATYAMDALSVTGFASNRQATESGVNSVEVSAMGLGASYDLGGGAKVVGGIARRGTTTGTAAEVTDNAADIGLSFSF